MFGPRWLVAPQYTYKAASRTVYLPKLSAGQEWVYWYNMSSVGR
jgi:alpha-glucosidase (family GH31 glycosyl hydrolase)